MRNNWIESSEKSETPDPSFYEDPINQEMIAQGFAFGMHGMEPNHDALLEIANRNWHRARDLVCHLLIKNPVDENIRYKLYKYYQKGWMEAKDYIAKYIVKRTYGFSYDTCELMRLASEGSIIAQKYVSEGLAKGKYGFKQDHITLKELKYESSYPYIIKGYEYGWYGFKKNKKEFTRKSIEYKIIREIFHKNLKEISDNLNEYFNKNVNKRKS